MQPGVNTLERNYQRKLLYISKSMNSHLIGAMQSTLGVLNANRVFSQMPFSK